MWHRLPALLLCGFGTGTLLAAALAPEAISAAWPALSRMGVLSAAAFALAGVAMVLPTNRPWQRRAVIGTGVLLVGLGAYTLMAVSLGHNETQALRPLLQALPAGDRLVSWPGRVSLPVAIALVCGGLTLALLQIWPGPRSAVPLQSLIALSGLTGLIGLLISLTGIDNLYRLHPQIAVLQWPAASGILLLSLSLALAAAHHPPVRAFYQDRQDRQVLVLSGGLLLSLLLAAWSLGVGMLVREWVAHSERAMLAAAKAEATLLDSHIAHHAIEARELLALSGIVQALTLPAGAQRDAALSGAATRVLQLAGHAGIVALEIQNGQGQLTLRRGYPPEDGTPFLALAHPPHSSVFLGAGFGLRSRLPLEHEARSDLVAVIDAVLTDQPAQGALSADGLSGSRYNLCMHGAALPRCFRYQSSRWLAVPELAAHVGPRERPEVRPQILESYRPSGAERYALAQAPVGASGLSIVLDVPVKAMLLPLQTQIIWAIATLLASAALGLGLIRRQAQQVVQRLLRARQELALVLDHAPEAILLTDATGRILRANRGAENLFGTPLVALEGKLIDALVPDVSANPEGQCQGLLQGADGTRRAVAMTETAFAAQREPRRLFILRDVSAQVRAQKERERWTRVFENAGWGIALANADGSGILLVNPAFAAMHGYAPGELLGAPLARVLAPPTPGEPANTAAALLQGAAGSLETTQQRKDGSHFAALVNITLISGENGAVVYRAMSVQDISESKAAQAALARSEALLRAVLQALPVGVWVTDAAGRIVHGNSAGKAIWGGARYIGVEHYGQFRGWWPGTGRRIEAHEWALAKAIAQGETTLEEVVNIEAFDGIFKTIANSAIPLLDKDGKVEGAIVVNEDITARVRAEEELRISKELFQTIVTSASLGLALSDPEGRLLLVNEALCRILGYADAELLEKPLLDLFHPTDRGGAARLMAGTLAGEICGYELEKRFVHHAGYPVWGLFAAALVRGDDGQPKYFIVQLVDITARKLAEERLRTSEARLARAQSLAHIGDWDWHLGEGTMRWSAEAQSILGASDQNRNLLELAQSSAVHAQDRAKLLATVRSALAGDMKLAIDFRIQGPTGEERILHLQGEVLRDQNGAVAQAIGTLQDITASKAVESELRASRERLRALSAHLEHAREQERKRIALEVHDELGQLLTSLHIQISLLRLDQKGRREAGTRLTEMRHLVEKTLAVARNLVANLRPTALNFGLVPGLEWLVDEFRQHNDIACSFAADIEDRAVDEELATLFFRVAQEALTNVTRHARARHCQVQLHGAGNTLRLRIRDDGCGFNLEQALSGKTYGLLGMRERAHRHDCTLHIDTAPGRGTIVTIVHSRHSS